MYLGLGILLLIFSIAIIIGIIFSVYKAVKHNKEIPLSKSNLLYLIPTFILIYALHIIAYTYNGNSLEFYDLFNLISTTLDVVKFKADKNLLLPICNEYPIYYVNFALAFLAGGASLILGIASFFGLRLRNSVLRRKLIRRGCDIVVGDCEDTIKYAENNEHVLIMLMNSTSSRYVELMKKGFIVANCSFSLISKKLKKARYNFIMFRAANISYTTTITSFIDIKKQHSHSLLLLEAEQGEIKVIKDNIIPSNVTGVKAFVNCFTRHELIARDFVSEYPISSYIPRDFYNDNFSIKKDKDINIVFLGFGRMNYQLFRMFSMQFQFAYQENDKFHVKPINYYIYDSKSSALNNEFFSRIDFEFDEEYKHCDFPKPEKICNIKSVKQLDINSIDARKEFYELVNEDSYTYFVISLTNDLEDASYAQTLKRIFRNQNNYHIFVRAKYNVDSIKDDKITLFGHNDINYSHKHIVNDDLNSLALKINSIYYAKDDPDGEWLRQIKKINNHDEKLKEMIIKAKEDFIDNQIRNKWEEIPLVEQLSNIYNALSIQFKLGILGFEMVKEPNENDEIISEDKYKEIYINSGVVSDYKDVNFYFKDESSNLLAFIEHSRWNALYILYDYVQMPKSNIKISNNKIVHKDHHLKQHACLTTYYGLKELIDYEFSLKYPNQPINEDDPNYIAIADMYKWDYMGLDDLYKKVLENKYKLIKI